MKKKNNGRARRPIYIKSPWETNENTIWLASTLTLFRNIEKFSFPAKLSSERCNQVVTLVGGELLKSPLLSDPQLVITEAMTPLEKEFVFEHFLTTFSFQHGHRGEAFVLDETGEFLAALNFRDHIQLQMTDCKGDLEGAWNRLVKIETALGKVANYAFSPRFGFLTAEAAQAGTAFVAAAFLQLSALAHTGKLEEVLDRHQDENIAITGVHGDPHELVGDLLSIHNQFTLGVTEENIISSIRSFVAKIMAEEEAVRKALRKKDNPELRDRVSRAFGILAYSYQIEAAEALNALALVKLGVDVGWITGIQITVLNELFFHCRRAHLLCDEEQHIAPEELPHKRSQFIRNALKDAQVVT